MFTVVMPFYNTPPFLTEAALQSVVDQGFEDAQVVVVDDGSTPEAADALDRLAARFRSKLLVEVIRQENRGPGAARNRGVAAARYEIVAQLDSDDRWAPGKMAAQIAALEKDPKTWMVFGAIVLVDTEGKPLKDRGGRERIEVFAKSPERQYLSLLQNNLINNSTACFRKRGFEELGGYDSALPPAEDADLWIRACRKGLTLRFLEAPMGHLVRHGANISLQEEKRRKAWMRILDRELHHPPAFLEELPPEVVEGALASAWFKLGRYARMFGQRSLAREAFRNSFRHRPSARAGMRWLGTVVGF